MLAALQRSAKPFAVACAFIPTEQAKFLENLEVVDRLTLSAPDRDTVRLVVRESAEAGAPVYAVGCGSVADAACTAAHIARIYSERSDVKLLVFAERAELEAERGIPFHVGQKVSARQLVLDTRPPDSGRGSLLTWSGVERPQIVDRTPSAGSDRF